MDRWGMLRRCANLWNFERQCVCGRLHARNSRAVPAACGFIIPGRLVVWYI